MLILLGGAVIRRDTEAAQVARQNALAEAMRANGWTVSQVARMLGRTRQTVHRWLNGRHPVPASMEEWLREHSGGGNP